jgi:hypothetical protein
MNVNSDPDASFPSTALAWPQVSHAQLIDRVFAIERLVEQRVSRAVRRISLTPTKNIQIQNTNTMTSLPLFL